MRRLSPALDGRPRLRTAFIAGTATLIGLGVALCLLCAPGVYAATPTRISFEGDANTDDGKKYSRYTVRCSNGQVRALTAWDNRRIWCVSRDARSGCHQRQLAAARQSCQQGD